MRSISERERKEALDRQTDYLTFLPHMDEGFHTGYHSAPGVVSDGNQRPREWLESLARNMRTQGHDVSYSIPDVLACEQQLRRLARLKPEAALAHQEMIDFRAVLALLLLWDTWEADESWPRLEISCLSDETTAFAASVAAALSPVRAPDGLWIFTLRSARDTEALVRPIALLSSSIAIAPAADPGDLSALLPPCVGWYDRRKGRFADPCNHLSARDAFLLTARLRTLQRLAEEEGWHSPLHRADSQLVSLLDRFADDIAAVQDGWMRKLRENNEAAVAALRLRALAACTLADGSRIIRPADYPDAANPLLNALGEEGLPSPASDELEIYTLEGEAFACRSAKTLFAPVGTVQEQAVLSRLDAEVRLLERHDAHWRSDASAALRSLKKEVGSAAGLLDTIPQHLSAWADALDAIPVAASREITLDYPLAYSTAAVSSLLSDTLGLAEEGILTSPFSDALVILSDEAPYDDEVLNRLCRIEGLGTAVPPLSPELARWLTDLREHDSHYAPLLEPESLCFEKQGDAIAASFTIVRRSPEQGSAIVSAITFRRIYRISSRMEKGAAYRLRQSPGVAVWPNIRLQPGLWKKYYVFSHQPDEMSAWVWAENGWQQGELHASADERWQTVCTSAFPAFVALKRGELSLGVLINDLPRSLIRHEPPAAAAIDFGSISTTVMLRQGERIQPAVLPEKLHRILLRGQITPDTLAGFFLPENVLLPDGSSIWYSLMDQFSDEPDRWKQVLCDGHIFYRTSLEALTAKNASALYYDLKWSEERYAQRVVHLFLKQVMLQASLSARLWGSSSISYRISMPGAMPLHRQEAYLEMIRGLARETAQETGLPLTPGIPSVLYTSENHADGLYFLNRSEINAHSGYLNMDIGGSTADLSLWLGGAQRAAMECSLLLGCRQMLFESMLSRHADDFISDFSGADEPLREAIRQTVSVFRAEGGTVRGLRKCMLLMDDLLASQSQALCKAMAACRESGRISYLESLMLLHTGLLFYLAGEMLNRAWQDEGLQSLLPERMEICIAGNGGQMIKSFSDEQHTRLCSLALARLDESHPLKVLLPVQSRHPKEEAARGLLYDDSLLYSTLSDAERWNGTRPDHPAAGNLVESFLMLFAHVFPQAAQRLMPGLWSEGSVPLLSATAAMELDTVFANEATQTQNDEMAMYIRCFEAVKRLWRI